jgi:hypothetical protein
MDRIPDFQVLCDNGHDRIRMEKNYEKQWWTCPKCHHSITPTVALDVVPPRYREPIVLALTDARVEVIYDGHKLHVEYPRPSLDPLR